MPEDKKDSRLRTRHELKFPEMYVVIMHNDDFTPMDFVVMLLKTVFTKPSEEAVQLMMTVHKKGQATIGEYTYDIAQSKSQKAMRMAREAGYPFKLTIENRGLPF